MKCSVRKRENETSVDNRKTEHCSKVNLFDHFKLTSDMEIAGVGNVLEISELIYSVQKKQSCFFYDSHANYSIAK